MRWEASVRSEARRISYARTAVRVLPTLLIVAGGCYDYFTPPEYTAAPFFAAAPLVAAPLLSLWGTVLTGVAALVVVFLVRLPDIVFDVEAVTELITVVTVAVLAVLINILVRRSGERLASARRIAEAVQRAVLPEPAERIGGFRIAARYEAAQADALIGGDLYAVHDSPYGVRLVVGDVRGKGMQAVAAVTVLIGAFREAAEQEGTLAGVARRLERALTREGDARHDSVESDEGFATAVLAELPRGDRDEAGVEAGDEAGVVRILNRGHPPPLLLGADGAVRPLPAREPALPLGMGELGASLGLTEEAAFPAGATLLFHTDGLSETRDAHGRFYDPEARLAGRTFPDPGALLGALADDVRRYAGGGGLTDDMALLAVRRS